MTRLKLKYSPSLFQQKVRNSITTARIAIIIYVWETATVTDRQILWVPGHFVLTKNRDFSHQSYPLTSLVHGNNNRRLPQIWNLI